MTEGQTETHGPRYTQASCARLVMAYEAYELAELARTAVPIGARELTPDGIARSPGSLLADAAHILTAAHRLVEATTVFERLGGTGWQVIGDVLGISARAAQDRFAEVTVRFRKHVLSPEDNGCADPGTVSWRQYMAREPLESALDLDDWVLRHEDGDSDLGAAPVSGGLVRMPPERQAETPS